MSQKKKTVTRDEDEDSESDLWARKPTRHRKKKHKMPEKDGIVKVHATGKVYHTSTLCQYYKGGKSSPKCSVCVCVSVQSMKAAC